MLGWIAGEGPRPNHCCGDEFVSSGRVNVEILLLFDYFLHTGWEKIVPSFWYVPDCDSGAASFQGRNHVEQVIVGSPMLEWRRMCRNCVNKTM